jgi:small subunit ribosomal protein S10
METFEIGTHKRIIDVIEPTPKTIDSLSHLQMPAGVGIDIVT